MGIREEEDVINFKWINLVLVCVSVIVMIIGLKIGVIVWWKPRRIEIHFSKQGIRGPPYRLFIGNVKELVQMMLKASTHPILPFSHNILPRVLPFYYDWKKIYGATFLVWFGPTARLAVLDPDLIREIFTTKSELYEKIEAHPLVKQLEGDGLLSLKGEKWALHKKMISPTFHMQNLKLLVPVVAKSVMDMLDKWSEMSNPGEVEIEVSRRFETLTEDVITRTVFGSSYEDGKPIFQLQAQQMLLAADAFQMVSVPGYRYFLTRRNVKAWRLEKKTRELLMKLIDRRRGNSGEGDKKGAKDLLGLMIEASKTRPNVTVNDIIEECKSFFFAGKHTTSNLLTWTTVLLAMHPQWQVLARDEVVKVCGSRGIPSKDDVVKLKTLNMILNESLRLYPPVIATIRRSRIDVDLGGYKIPGGTELLIPILALHHDQAIWGGDANDFNPRRFSQSVAKAEKQQSMAFIPFGLGARTCIGKNLAILQAKLTLAVILKRFSFKLASTYQHSPTVLMFLYPQYGAPIIYKRLADCQDDPSMNMGA